MTQKANKDDAKKGKKKTKTIANRFMSHNNQKERSRSPQVFLLRTICITEAWQKPCVTDCVSFLFLASFSCKKRISRNVDY